MRLSHIITSAFAYCSLANCLDFSSSSHNVIERRSSINDLQDISGDFDELTKRSSSGVSAIESILLSVNSSGIIWKTLDGIAASDTAMDNLANIAISVLNGNTSAIDDLGLKINLNTSNIMDKVMDSGLIQSTAEGLLIDDANRSKIANFTGNILENKPWVSKILADMNNGQEPTVQYIADTIQNFKPKGVNDNNSKNVVFGGNFKRDDNEGSASAFLNNFVNSIVDSQLVSGSLDDILTALNDTGVLVDFAIQALDQKSLGTIINYVVPKVYNAGALDHIDINAIFQQSKESHAIANIVDYVFTSPTWAPPIAKLFKQIQDAGTFEVVRYHLFGPVGS